MSKRTAIWALLLMVIAVPLMAQSNDRVDELLEQDVARLDSTLYLLLTSAQKVPDDTDALVAYETAVKMGIVSSGLEPDSPVALDVLCFLVMKTQSIPGGVGWMLFPSHRYAYKELSFKDVINTSAGPDRYVSGEDVIRTLSGALALKEGQK